jgi:CDP-glucose 4,6-dehydratase
VSRTGPPKSSLAFWSGRKVVITGHTGFKGAWLALWLQRLGAQVTGIALPPDGERSLYLDLAPWSGLEETLLDLRERERAIAQIGASDAEVLFHLAAQSLVPAAHRDAAGTFATNVMGTVHVLEGALRSSTLRAVLVVTSDKVYANAGDGRVCREADSLGGDEPYAASKSAAELAVTAYRAAIVEQGKAAATARAGNAIGGGDWAADRIVPDLLRSLDTGLPTAIREPAATRPWQHVLDPLAGYLAFAATLATGESDMPPALNFGPPPESCRTVEELVERLVARLPGHPGWKAAPAPWLREAQALRLDSSRAQATLGWQARLPFAAAVDWTADWYEARCKGAEMRAVTLEQIARYEAML